MLLDMMSMFAFYFLCSLSFCYTSTIHPAPPQLWGSHFSPLKFAILNGETDDVKNILQVNSSTSKERDSLGMTPLHWAAVLGHSDIVELLLSEGADHDAADQEMNSPLHFCTDSDTCYKLIIAGSDINRQNMKNLTPLHLAVSRNKVKIVIILLRFDALTNIVDSQGRSALDVALETGFEDIIRLLKSSGAKVIKNGTTTNTTNFDFLKENERFSNRETHVRVLSKREMELANAAKKGSEKDIIDLCSEGVDPNVADITDQNYTPLHHASEHGNTLAVIILLRFGANINEADKNGDTPLHVAIKNKHYMVTDILMVNGADYQIANSEGISPFQLAQTTKNQNVQNSFKFGVVEWFQDIRHLSDDEKEVHKCSKEGYYITLVRFCKAGVDIQVKDVSNNENTALHIAVTGKQGHNVPTIQVLIKCGININAQNKDGNTALHLAVAAKDDNAFMVLMLNKADPFIDNKKKETAYQEVMGYGTNYMKQMFKSPNFSRLLHKI